MKIISGKYKGRNLSGYQIEGTRPTQDRIKESLFGMIQEEIPESLVLDLFAGTGNLALEALSNGSKQATVVDKNPLCTKQIEKIGNLWQEKNLEIYTMDYKKSLALFQKEQKQFTLIFLDPPYQYENLEEILTELDQKNLVKQQGIIVCEYENDDLKESYPHYQREKYRQYGTKRIAIYRYEKESV